MGYSKSIDESLERLRWEFEKTRNPLILFAAYGITRRFPEDPIPEWILKALDEIAGSLKEAGRVPEAQSPGFDWQSAIMQSLGFPASPRGGPSNPFRVGARRDDCYTFAVRMRVLIDVDGQQPTYAAEEVAKYFGVSATTVRRAWKDYGSIVTNENLEEQTWSVVAGDHRFFSQFIGSHRLAYYGKPLKDVLEEMSPAELQNLIMYGALEEWP